MAPIVVFKRMRVFTRTPRWRGRLPPRRSSGSAFNPCASYEVCRPFLDPTAHGSLTTTLPQYSAGERPHHIQIRPWVEAHPRHAPLTVHSGRLFVNPDCTHNSSHAGDLTGNVFSFVLAQTAD